MFDKLHVRKTVHLSAKRCVYPKRGVFIHRMVWLSRELERFLDAIINCFPLDPSSSTCTFPKPSIHLPTVVYIKLHVRETVYLSTKRRGCSRDTYPESYITKHITMRRSKCGPRFSGRVLQHGPLLLLAAHVKLH